MLTDCIIKISGIFKNVCFKQRLPLREVGKKKNVKILEFKSHSCVKKPVNSAFNIAFTYFNLVLIVGMYIVSLCYLQLSELIQHSLTDIQFSRPSKFWQLEIRSSKTFAFMEAQFLDLIKDNFNYYTLYIERAYWNRVTHRSAGLFYTLHWGRFKFWRQSWATNSIYDLLMSMISKVKIQIEHFCL